MGASLSPAEIGPAVVVVVVVNHRGASADITVRCEARLVAGGPRSRTTQGQGNEGGALFGKNAVVPCIMARNEMPEINGKA